ncbi:hypothetical protein PMAC_001786 [Pneumocystis sp. 'macacae']|nr:hypothetical protein PMAC_001786 [Pneumocystis sp. 'macacae']
MNNKNYVDKDLNIPVVVIEDSPECEKLNTIFPEKNQCSVMDISSCVSLKRIKSDEDEQSIIDISSSSSVNFINEHDTISSTNSEDVIKEEDLGLKRHSPHTSSILSTVDEFLLNVINSTPTMGLKAYSDYSSASDGLKLKNDCDSKSITMINQKILENTRKKVEKKRFSTLKNVNKLKSSKKECIKEMIVDIDKNILSSPLGSMLSDLFKKSGCEFNEWLSPIPNLIFWKRKVVAEYDKKLGYFVPIPEVIRPEQYVLVYMKASELLKIESNFSIDESVKQIVKEFPDSKIIYMIESIDALLKKIKNNRNRHYADVIRANIETNNPETILTLPEEIDDEKIENMMLHLQLVHNAFILLQMIHKVTPQIANIIIEKYPKISYLVSAFCENGPDALSDLMIGNLMKRKIGPVLSKRIFHAFMTSDSKAYAI